MEVIGCINLGVLLNFGHSCCHRHGSTFRKFFSSLNPNGASSSRVPLYDVVITSFGDANVQPSIMLVESSAKIKSHDKTRQF